MLLFTIFIIIAIEIISFFYIKVENVAYLFHWLGFVYGFIISLIFMWDKRTNKYNVKYLFISSNILSMLSVFFIYTYITNWTPQNINFLGNNISNSCCYQIFTENQIQNKCRLQGYYIIYFFIFRFISLLSKNKIQNLLQNRNICHFYTHSTFIPLSNSSEVERQRDNSLIRRNGEGWENIYIN